MKEAEQIRAFNRFYLPYMHFLGNHYLGSQYSAVQARIFYEIYNHEGCTSKELCIHLELDKGFMSRILKKYEKEGLLVRQVKPNDARSYGLYLTEKGKSQAEKLIDLSNQDIEGLIAHLNRQEKKQLLEAFHTIYHLLGEKK